MRTEELLKLLEGQISADRICHTAQAVHELDQWNSFDKYRQTADLLERELRGARADAVERFVIPCDGETTFGDWVMPLAWDAEEGTLELLGPDGRCEQMLADYKAVPNNLIRWSAPTDGPRELSLVYLPEGAKEASWLGADVKGKLVFTHSPAREARRWAARYEALGVVSDFSTAPEAFPHCVHWENVWTDLALWGPTLQDVPVVGFCLSPAVGRELKGRFANRRALRVRANVRAKLYAGATDVVTATIAGTRRPDEEIVLYAHVYECQIDDNATSAAACIEMVRVARNLMEAGAIQRPDRTIRFVLGWEWIGSTYFAMNHRSDKKWLGSLCLDGMAHKQSQTLGPISISMSPTSAASFADALYIDTWKSQFRRRLRAKAWHTSGWTMGTDTYWIDPHMGQVSNVYPFQNAGPTWHKSHTNVDMIDRDVARGCATASLAWMLQVAGAGPAEAQRFARLCADRAERHIRKYADSFDFARPDVEAAREQFLDELGYQHEAALRMIDTSILAPDDAPLRKTIELLHARIEATVRDVREQALAALRAARAGLSEWEARRPADLGRDRDERVADNLVPTRLAQGYLWSLHRFSSEDRQTFQEFGRLDPLALFLCDGKRTLRQIARRREFDQGPVNLRNLLRHFRMLAQAGYVQLDTRRTFSEGDLLKDLRGLGIQEGDTILVHSSLSSLCLPEGEAETAFRALERAVGPAGTLCMPAFAYGTLEKPVFDPATTPARTGELPDLFWRRPSVLRSRHPSHGLAAWGKWAQSLVEGNEKLDPYSIGGAFGKLYQLDAKIVMIGCGVVANSTLHAVEDWADFPTMVPGSYHYLDAAGERVQVEYKKIPQGNRDFYTYRTSAYERLFRDKGIIREGTVGLARTFIMRSRDVMEYGLELLRAGSYEFLMGKNMRDPLIQAAQAKVKSDWKFPEGIWERMKALREKA
jgi:aminoglycoside 3-N-acetyltransferase